MNRRTVLRSAGVLATIALSGCVQSIQDHFQGSVRGIVPIEIHSEADRHYDVRLEAYARGEDRQTYDEGYSVTPGQTVTPPHLNAIEQDFRVTKLHPDTDETTSREATVTPGTDLIRIEIHDDDLLLDVQRGDADGANPDSEPGSNPGGEVGPDEGEGESDLAGADSSASRDR